jgi:hypothetical protein
MSIPVPFDATNPVAARRFVTAHDENGKAVFKFENEIPRTAFTEDPRKRALFAVSKVLRHRTPVSSRVERKPLTIAKLTTGPLENGRISCRQ